jgi:hypothetical protein
MGTETYFSKSVFPLLEVEHGKEMSVPYTRGLFVPLSSDQLIFQVKDSIASDESLLLLLLILLVVSDLDEW